MKVGTVVLIALVPVVGFVGLLSYGLRHARGVPTVAEPPGRLVVRVPSLARELDLSKGVDLSAWKDLTPVRVDLVYQVTIQPWSKKLVPWIEVRAFRNAQDIYFYLSWPDEAPDQTLGPATFSDGCAIMFPLDPNVQPSSILMGFLGRSSIWHWKASRDAAFWQKPPPGAELPYADYYYPFEDQETLPVSMGDPQLPVVDLLAVRIGTVTPKSRQIVVGRGLWTNATWHVVMKRALEPEGAEASSDALLGPGRVKLCAFAVWNGAAGDRGGRKSISDFVELVYQP